MSSQLQVSGEAKIRDIQGPVVANSGVITALDGAASQYVRGDGTLADFPTSSGGGSSVSYYLNSSVSQGTIGGVAYRELSKDPIIGAGTDIPISTNGYVANYITDANDPDVTIVPGGNFNCEFYFSVNNNTGNPFTYAELYKYDGTTFTLLGSSVGVPEYINQGTIIAPYYFAIPVATAALALTDRLAIRIYVDVDGRTVTLHTENGHLCQVVTTLSKGMVSLNNLTDQSQFLTTGTSGTNFAIVSSGDTHTFNLPTASATNTGKLSSTDWSTFNNKQAALSFTAPLVNTANTISIPVATSLVDGYLDNADWVKFNTAYNDSIVSAAVTGTTTKTLTLTQQDAGTITASWTDDNTDAVSSVFGRTGAVVAQSGDYNTSQVTELTNLYFTDARSRLALSFAAGSGAYNSTTGVITIPTNNNQITNGSNFITLGSLSAGTGISYNNTTGVITNSAPDQTVSLANGAGISVSGTYPSFTIASTITQYTDALARAAISLTTTGTSGAATYNSTTGVLNIPNYTPDLSGYVTISTTQTITGNKTFSEATRQDSGLLLKNGVLAGATGYASLGGASNGLVVQLSGSANQQTLIFQSGAAYSYTLPATSGTLALTSQLTSGTVTSVGLSSATSGVTIGSSPITTSGTITLAIATASGSQNGLLSSTDWTTFNNKQSALTNPVTGTGTTNYLPKFTGASTIGNSAFYDGGGFGGFNSTGLGARTFIIQAANARPLALEMIEYANVHAVYVRPNNSGYNLISSNYISGGVYIPLALSGRENSNDLVIWTDGNTSIGQSSNAGYKLDVSGTGRFTSALSGTSATFTNTSGETLTLSKGTGPSIQFNKSNATAQNWAISTDPNFNIYNYTLGGIPFSINAATNAATFSSSVTAGNTINTNDGFYSSKAGSDSIAGGAYIQFTNAAFIQANAGLGLDFWTLPTGGGGWTRRMTLTNGGSLGIGTSSPVSVGDHTSLTINGSSLSRLDQFVGGASVGLLYSAGNFTMLQTNAAYSLLFGTNDTERMRITSGGNVLIGTTTDSGQKMQVNGITKTAGLSLGATTFSSSTTMTDAYFFWEFTGGAGVTLTLYSSSGNNNTHFIKNSSGVSLTISGTIMTLTSGAPTSSITLAAYKTIQLISRGGGSWYIMYQTT